MGLVLVRKKIENVFPFSLKCILILRKFAFEEMKHMMNRGS